MLPNEFGPDAPATEEFMEAKAAMADPANWTADARACGCVFWTFQHPATDDGTLVKPWEAIQHG